LYFAFSSSSAAACLLLSTIQSGGEGAAATAVENIDAAIKEVTVRAIPFAAVIRVTPVLGGASSTGDYAGAADASTANAAGWSDESRPVEICARFVVITVTLETFKEIVNYLDNSQYHSVETCYEKSSCRLAAHFKQRLLR
jgi:hypothetical protein